MKMLVKNKKQKSKELEEEAKILHHKYDVVS